MDTPAEVIAARARELRASPSTTARPVVVAIDGPSGAGKTELAAAVAALLGDAPVVHMDDLYAGWNGASQGSHLLVTRVLRPLRRGKPATYNRYDWHAKGYSSDVTSVPVAEFLVVEGVLATYGDAHGLVDVAVWLDAPEQVRKERALARDGDMFAPHWDRWADLERAHFGPDETAWKADLSFDTAHRIS